MPSLGALTRQVRLQAHVDLGEGVEIEIGFDRNRITPAWIVEAEKRDEANDYQSVPKALMEVMLDWDVANEDGSPLPPSVEVLAQLSFPVQAEILGAIVAAAVPSRAEGEVSSPTRSPSSVEAPPDSSSESSSISPPNGAAGSESLNVSASPSPM